METYLLGVSLGMFHWKPGGRTPKGNGDSIWASSLGSVIGQKPGGRTPKGNGDLDDRSCSSTWLGRSQGAERRKAMETYK